MDKRKDPITSVLDDFNTLSDSQQEIVLQTITQLRRRDATKTQPAPRKRKVTSTVVPESVRDADQANREGFVVTR